MVMASAGLNKGTIPPPISSVVFETATNASVTAGSAISFTHTVGSNSDRLLVLFMGNRNVGIVTSATFDGVSLSFLGSSDLGVSDAPRSEIWYLINPNSVTGELYTEFSGEEFAQCTVADFSNVNQPAPFNTFISASATSASSIEIEVSGNSGGMSVSCLSYWNDTSFTTPFVGQTIIGEVSSDGAWSESSSYVTWSNPTIIGWDSVISTGMALSAVTILPL
jgi:hypothetical protein